VFADENRDRSMQRHTPRREAADADRGMVCDRQLLKIP
jgi:hypothetical protein